MACRFVAFSPLFGTLHGRNCDSRNLTQDRIHNTSKVGKTSQRLQPPLWPSHDRILYTDRHDKGSTRHHNVDTEWGHIDKGQGYARTVYSSDSTNAVTTHENGCHLNVQFLDVVDGTDREVVFTRQRQAVGELAGIERTHGINLIAAAQRKRCAV